MDGWGAIQLARCCGTVGEAEVAGILASGQAAPAYVVPLQLTRGARSRPGRYGQRGDGWGRADR